MANRNKTQVKQELIDSDPTPRPNSRPDFSSPASIIDLSSSDSDSDSSSSSSDDDGDNSNINSNKRPRDSSGGDNNSNNARRKKKDKKMAKDLNAVLPLGFLDPLPSKMTTPLPLVSEQSSLVLPSVRVNSVVEAASNKQFWKAGEYEGAPGGDWDSAHGGMDHVRVHPKFLHSNATSHKWVLGALAELLDNSMDEVCNGATYVNINMVQNKKDGSKMLLIEDNGGGMDPDKMRHCMSLGYSAKSNMVNTIGQYGNGFKTSTMRLGADVIVFSRSCGNDGRRQTQSIGLLSYTFLKNTGKEDIVVPMFDQITDQGTKIIIYNLWEDDQGLLELDFDTDLHDIQIRGVNRDEKSIDMAKKHPNSRHFLTYRHSLRSYAAILYLRIPPAFRIILRGKDVEHHNIVNDMMMSQEITYRPQSGDGIPKDHADMVAIVTVGFVKDAKAHIDVQGFNVYHKNRLIKPFWRVWHPPGSDGRGVIGVLEANFVEPAHDKQGFERTTILARLETRLIQMQKTYWSSNCHKIGYAPRRNKKSFERDISPESFPQSPQLKRRSIASSDKTQTKFMDKGHNNGHLNGNGDVRTIRKRTSYAEESSSSAEDVTNFYSQNHTSRKQANGLSSTELSRKVGPQNQSVLRGREAAENNLRAERPARVTRNSANTQEDGFNSNGFPTSSPSSHAIDKLKIENLQLKERLKRKEEEILGELLLDLQKEREKSKSLEAQLEEATKKYEEISKEQDSLIDIFSEERQRRDIEEENLRKKLKDASNTIQQLLDKLRFFEKMSSSGK
ncbi:hypothetical protein BUALT_Bualt07G0091400 [Buddleja alternifolia]|uniref:Morc S5 domain-containing protein n=1 Tax=Buddleja alternifolia TaxID=168488 RepID=A0AAV6X8N4_9LAMI|nr:hypothetical protein BUALT_Bualt07G0091400 [Buddleja alternifolia]